MHLFQYSGSICVVQRRHPRNPRFSTRLPWPLAAIVLDFIQGQSPSVDPLSLTEKDQGFVSAIFSYQRLAKWGPSSSVFYKEKASCTGGLYSHEFKFCHVELTSCCCCHCCAADGRYPNCCYNYLFFTWWNDCLSVLQLPFLYVAERLLLWDVQALVALLDCYVHARIGKLIAAGLLPGPSGRAATVTLPLTTWSQQSGSGLVAWLKNISISLFTLSLPFPFFLYPAAKGMY